MEYKESKPFPSELNLCANCGGYFGKVKKKDLNDYVYCFNKNTGVEVGEEYLTVFCACDGRRCLGCGRYNQAPGSNVYCKKTNHVKHVSDFMSTKGCNYCGREKFEDSILDVEKCHSLGEWYSRTGLLGYDIPLAMCLGIKQATKKWNLSIKEVFRLFLACGIIHFASKVFVYDIRGHESIKKLYVHHCYYCDIWRITMNEKENCLECGKECGRQFFDGRNEKISWCAECHKELAIGEGFCIGAWLNAYFCCRKCAIERYPHLKVYFKADP